MLPIIELESGAGRELSELGLGDAAAKSGLRRASLCALSAAKEEPEDMIGRV